MNSSSNLQDLLRKLLEEAGAIVVDQDSYQSKLNEELEAMSDEEKVELCALQAFKVIDKKDIETWMTQDPGTPYNLDKGFMDFRNKVFTRALELYSHYEMLPDLEAYIKAGGKV